MACRLYPILNEDDEEQEEEDQEDHKNCHDDFVPVCVIINGLPPTSNS